MISVFHVLLNNFVIDITILSLYCVSVTALSVKVVYLQNRKIPMDNQTERRIYRQTYAHTILPLREVDGMAFSRMRCAQLRPTRIIDKKRCGRPEKHTYIRAYKLDWTPLGSFGTQCGYECIATLDPHTVN